MFETSCENSMYWLTHDIDIFKPDVQISNS